MSQTLHRLAAAHPVVQLDQELHHLADEAEMRVVYGPLDAVALFKPLPPTTAKVPVLLEPPMVFTAHRDQIALRIGYYDDDGFAFVVPVGGWDPQVLLGQRMAFSGTSGVIRTGVVGRKAVHLLKDEESKSAVKLEDMWVDFGFKSEKEGLAALPVGSIGVIDVQPVYLANNRLASRALDDLIGVSAIYEAMRRITTGVSMYGVFTQHEETIFLGASGAWAASLTPGVVVAVDVTFAEDPSTAAKDNGNLKMGKGPVIYVGGLLDDELTQALIAVAGSTELPFQVAAVGGHTSTDADGMALADGGRRVLLLSVPIRYMHSPIETVDLTDYENLIKLLVTVHQLVSSLP